MKKKKRKKNAIGINMQKGYEVWSKQWKQKLWKEYEIEKAIKLTSAASAEQ